MTVPLDIDALHATWKAATPGEWVQGPFPQVDSTDDEIYVFPSGKCVGSTEHPIDATAIVALHNAFPAIYDRLRELEAERDAAMREVPAAQACAEGALQREIAATARAEREAAERDRANERWDTARLALRDAKRELRIFRNSEAGDIVFAQLREEEATARADREAALRQTAEADADAGWGWAFSFDEWGGHRCTRTLSDAERERFHADLQRHEDYDPAVAERARTEGE